MLDHMGFAVRDYQRSKAFYEKALLPVGLTLSWNHSGKPRDLARKGSHRSGSRPAASPCAAGFTSR